MSSAPNPPPSPSGELRVRYSSILTLICVLLLGLGAEQGVKWFYDRATATPTLILPDVVKGGSGQIIAVTAKGTATDIHWHSSDRNLHIADRTLLSDPNTILVTAQAPGDYVISAYGSLHNRATDIITTHLVISGEVPPGPSPTPEPPGPKPPTPPPTPPAPIPAKGLHVLIVYDEAKAGSLSAEQTAILGSDVIRDYVNSKTQGGIRVWRSSVDTKNEDQLWQDAFAKAKGKKLPWIIVSNGKTGTEQELPANVDATMTLLKLYGE